LRVDKKKKETTVSWVRKERRKEKGTTEKRTPKYRGRELLDPQNSKQMGGRVITRVLNEGSGEKGETSWGLCSKDRPPRPQKKSQACSLREK